MNYLEILLCVWSEVVVEGRLHFIGNEKSRAKAPDFTRYFHNLLHFSFESESQSENHLRIHKLNTQIIEDSL